MAILQLEVHSQRSLAGYGPQSRKESDTTEATKHVSKHRSMSDTSDTSIIVSNQIV